MDFIHVRGGFQNDRHFIRIDRLFARRERFVNHAGFTTRVRELLRLCTTKVGNSCFVVRIRPKRVNRATKCRFSHDKIKRRGERVATQGTRASVNDTMGPYSINNGIQRGVNFVTRKRRPYYFYLPINDDRFLVMFRHRFTTLFRT